MRLAPANHDQPREQSANEGFSPLRGSSLKVDGVTWNPVDPVRAEAFMGRVRETRAACQGVSV